MFASEQQLQFALCFAVWTINYLRSFPCCFEGRILGALHTGCGCLTEVTGKIILQKAIDKVKFTQQDAFAGFNTLCKAVAWNMQSKTSLRKTTLSGWKSDFQWQHFWITYIATWTSWLYFTRELTIAHRRGAAIRWKTPTSCPPALYQAWLNQTLCGFMPLHVSRSWLPVPCPSCGGIWRLEVCPFQNSHKHSL